MGALGAILLLCDTSPYAGDTYCDQWTVAGPGPWPPHAATRVITITRGNCGHMSQQQNQHFKYILQLFQTHMDLDKRAANSSPNIGGFAKRAHPARARYLNVNIAWRNRDLQPGGTEIESLEDKSDSL